MTIELGVIISAVSVACALIGLIFTQKRGIENDAKKSSSDMTALMVKIEYISTGITEIKTEIRSVKDDVKSIEQRLTVVEQSAKQAHKRLDEHIRQMNEKENEEE